jgi:general secretion pathway protein L
MPQRVLALELDAHELKAAVVETTFRDYRVIGFYREAVVADDGSLSEQVRRFLDAHQIEANTVLSSLPGDLVTFRTFFLPFRDRKRLDQTVPFELETQVPFGLDEIIVDYHVLRRDRTGCNLLAALVRRRDLEEHLALLKGAGLDPKLVDLAPLAMLNVLNLLGNELPETFVYISGTPRRTVVALYRNRQLVGLRTLLPTLPAGAAPALAAGNGHPEEPPELAAALFGEIRWTLMALNGGAVLEDGLPCVIAGDGVQFDQIGQELAATMGLHVRRLDERALRNVPPALHAELPRFVSPLGLALREVAPNGALGLNFRQGEFAYHRGADELRRALWRTGALAALVVALMVTNTYMGYQQLSRRLELLQGQIRNVFSQTLPDVRRISDDPLSQLQGEIDAVQKRLQLLSGVVPPAGATAVDVARTISTAIPDSLKIDIDDYIMDTEGVRIKAKTDSFETADAVKQSLLNTHYFADVQVKDVKAGHDGKVDFRLALSLSKEGGAAAAAAAPRP